MGDSDITPFCLFNNVANGDVCCLQSGTECTSDLDCCGTSTCVDIFGGSVGKKTCTEMCTETGETCSSGTDCCGGTDVRFSNGLVSHAFWNGLFIFHA